MKNTILKPALAGLGLLIFTACSKEMADLPGESGTELEVTVTAAGFADAEDHTPGTRATDEFDSGDRIGIVAVKDGVVLVNNLPLTYDTPGGNWTFAEGEGLWHIKDVEYIAYYPYDLAMESAVALAPEKTGIGIAAAIQKAFQPRPDQSPYPYYTASDLMLWNGQATATDAAARLDIALQHSMGLVIIAPFGIGENPISEVEITVTSGGMQYIPYAMLDKGNSTDPGAEPGNSDGTWRVLVKPGRETSASIRYRSAGMTFEWETTAPFSSEPGKYRKFNIVPRELP